MTRDVVPLTKCPARAPFSPCIGHIFAKLIDYHTNTCGVCLCGFLLLENHEALIQPLLTDPSAPLPPRIIPSVEKSRPPVYSPEVVTLLTSPFSRTTKALKPQDLSFPPTLPQRANPTSDMAKLLGPFS